MKRSKHLAGRLLAMALAATMCLGMSMTAFAAEGGGSTPGFNNGTAADKDYPDGMPNGDTIKDTSEVIQNIKLDQNVTPDVTGTAADVGKISVSGIESGLTVKAYRVVAPTYGKANGQFTVWTNLPNTVALVDENGNVPDKAFSKDNIAKAAMWARDNYEGVGVTASGDAAPADGKAAYQLSENGSAYEAMVSPGAYVLVVEGSEAKVYGAMVLSLSYNNFKTLSGWSLGLLNNQAFAKMQSEPTIDKYITWTKHDANETFQASDAGVILSGDGVDGKGITTSQGYGDKVYFDILVKNIPDYRGDNVLFKITDTLSAGLEFDGSDIQYAVFYNDGEGNHVGDKYADGFDLKGAYAVSASDIGATFDTTTTPGSVVWDWTKDNYQTTIGKYAGCDLVIRYGAKIVDADSMWKDNVASMQNGAKLDFTHNSLVSGGEDSQTVDPRHVYSFAFGIKKTAAENNSPLEGAVYVLYAYADDAGKIAIRSTDNLD